MICIGYDSVAKTQAIAAHCSAHRITKVVVFSPQRFAERLHPEQELVTYTELITYKFFYRLLQEIDQHTLVVVNECLRTQNRNDLTYNCLRHLINQSGHQLVFQYLPIINSVEDFMVLFDLATKSRWKRSRFDKALLAEVPIDVRPVRIELAPMKVATDAALVRSYEREKRKLFDSLGQKDPNTIPRNLYLLGGRAKLAAVDGNHIHVGRNRRFKLPNLVTYKEVEQAGQYVVFEMPFDFIDFTDHLFVSRQTRVPILTTDLKVDRWYMQRYAEWNNRLHESYSSIR